VGINEMKTLIAIDPGASGGIAVEWPDGSREFHAMPDNEANVWRLISELKLQANTGYDSVGASCCLEKVGGFCGKGQPGSAMFKFGRGVGVVVGVLLAAEIPFKEVTPQAWQKHVGAGTTGKRTKTQWKKHLQDMAQKRNPAHKITLKPPTLP
jgi:hypothetical protein